MSWTGLLLDFLNASKCEKRSGKIEVETGKEMVMMVVMMQMMMENNKKQKCTKKRGNTHTHT